MWPWRWMGPLIWTAGAAFLVWNSLNLEINPDRIARGLGRLGTVMSRAFPPDFSRAGLLASGVLESVEIATLSTLFGVMLGIPLAVLAARNVVALPVYAAGRGAMTLGRTFHELIVELAAEDRIPALVNIHDVPMARAFARRIVGLNDGRVVYDGPVDGLTPEVLERIYGGAPEVAR